MRSKFKNSKVDFCDVITSELFLTQMLLFQHEDVVNLDPEFYKACEHDLKQFCSNFLDKGQGKVTNLCILCMTPHHYTSFHVTIQ